MERDHWDKLFDEIYLRTYSSRLEKFESAEEALAAARLAGCEPPAELLDAPAGFGRHSIPLADGGYRVTAVDRSPAQLDEGRRRAGDAEWPRWVQADIRELPFANESFDAVLCLFSSIGYRGEGGDRQTLTEFLRVLRPGGALVIETMHRDRLMAIYQERGWEPLEGDAIVAEERRFDYVAGEMEVDHTLLAEGERRSIAYKLRVYTATELVRMLDDVGYGPVACLGDYEGGEFTRETRLVIRARKLGS